MTEVRNTLSPPTRSGPTEVPLPWILAVLLRDRSLILATAFVGLLLTAGFLALRPLHYTASFSFVPQSSQMQGREGLASLAGQFGIPLTVLGGGTQSPELYAELLKTREVLGPIALDSVPGKGGNRETLASFLGVSAADAPIQLEETLRRLRERVISTSVAVRTSGIVTARATTRSAQVSYAIISRLLEGLNRYNLVTRQTQAAAEKRFITGRLEAARAALRTAEDALQRFLQSNRQITNSPELMFQRDRLSREMTLREQVVSGLAQQYEDAQIREVRDTPVITVVEQPALPALPDPAHRIRIGLLGVLGGAVLGIGISLFRAGWKRRRESDLLDLSYDELATEWARLRSAMSRLLPSRRP